MNTYNQIIFTVYISSTNKEIINYRQFNPTELYLKVVYLIFQVTNTSFSELLGVLHKPIFFLTRAHFLFQFQNI